MRRRIFRWLISLLIVAVGFSAVMMWRAANFGTGPRDSASMPNTAVRDVAVVSNAVGGTVSFIDLATLEVVKTLNVIPDGANVGFFRDPIQSLAQGLAEGEGGLNYAQDTDVSRDGRVLFVSRGYIGDVAAIDIASGDIMWRTPISGVRADHMDISPNGETLFVSTLIGSGDKVEALNTANGAQKGAIQAGHWPHDVHVTADNKSVYVASLGDMLADELERGQSPDAYKITVADAETYDVQREYLFEAGIRPFQVIADGTRLYAQLSNTHAIVARDLINDTQVGRIDLPVAEGVSEADWDFEAPHHGLALSPDETMLCVAGRASDYAALVSVPDLVLVTTISVGNAPSWSEMTRNGRLCVLANTRSDDVSFVDLVDQMEIARVSVGRGPKHITLARVDAAALED